MRAAYKFHIGLENGMMLEMTPTTFKRIDDLGPMSDTTSKIVSTTQVNPGDSMVRDFLEGLVFGIRILGRPLRIPKESV
jgi:hypothetical protein